MTGLAQIFRLSFRIYQCLDGFGPVTPIANEDLERETEEKTSSVHFLRFEFTPEMIDSAKKGAAITMAIDHSAYRYQIEVLPEATRAALVKDFD